MHLLDDMIMCHSCDDICLCLGCCFRSHDGHEREKLHDHMDAQVKQLLQWKDDKLQVLESFTLVKSSIFDRCKALLDHHQAHQLKIQQKRQNLEDKLHRLVDLKENELNSSNGYKYNFASLAKQLKAIETDQKQATTKRQQVADAISKMLLSRPDDCSDAEQIYSTTTPWFFGNSKPYPKKETSHVSHMNLQDFLQPSPPINEEQFENYLQKLTSFISSEESDHFPNEALEKLFLHWNAGTKNVALKLSFFNLIARILYREDQEIMWQECQKKLNNEDILEVIHNLSNISKSREFSNFGFKFITEGIIKFLTSEDKDSNVAFGLLLTNKLLANEQLQTEVLNVWPEAFANCTRWLKSHDCKVQREILNFFRHFTSKSLLVNEKCLLTVEQLNDILLILCSLSDKERICQDLHWFGGHGKVGTKANLRLFVSLSLELLVLVQCSENWQRMYSQICSKFTSASEFIELFLDHDDMLMQMLFCVCKIHSKFSAKEESIICPHGLWLSVLLEIDFDHQILIDWLTSEPMAIQSILTYLKLLQQEWQSFVQISSQHQSPPKGPINSLAPCQKSDSMCILVEENVYGEARQLEVHLCAATEDPTEHEQQNTKTENQEPIWQRTLDMIIKLRLKIERLDSKELFPFNPTALVRAIENIENITDSG